MPSYPPLPHYFQNKQHGVVDATRRADGAHVMENMIALFEAITDHHAIGTNLVDHGSGAAECRVLVYNSYAVGGLIADGDIVEITEMSTGRKWEIVVNAAWDTDEIRFTPSDQILGTAKSTGYNNAAFIDDLDVRSIKSKAAIGASDFKTDGADAVTGEAIPVSTTDSTLLSDQVTENKDRLALVADATGLLDEVVTKEKIAADAFRDQAPARNLIKNGGMEYGPSILSSPGGYGGISAPDADAPFGWEVYSGASDCLIEIGTVFSGNYSLKFTGTNDDDGVQGELIPEFDVTKYRNREMVLTARVYAPADNVVKLGILGSGGAAWSAAGGASGAWTQLSYAFTVDPAETTLKVLIALAAAGSYSVYVDEVQLVEGTVAFAYHESTWEAASRNVKVAGLRNIILNKAFTQWSAGASAAPDGWVLDALGSTVANEQVEFVTRGNSAELDLVNGGWFKQFFGLLPAGGFYGNDLLADKYITATFWAKRKTASAVPITVHLFTHGSGGDVDDSWDIDPSDSEWHRYAVTLLAAADADSGYFAIENNGGAGSVDLWLDCVEVAISPYPLAYEMPDMFRLESYTWSLPSDPSGTADMYFAGVQQVWNCGKYMIPVGLYVRQSAASAGGSNEYSIEFGAVAPVVAAVTVGNTAGSGGWAASPPLDTWNITPTTDLKVTLSSYSGFATATTVLATAVFAVID